MQQFPIGNGLWLEDSNVSKWISPTADESAYPDPPGDYVYQTTFVVNGDPAAVSISGRYLGDDVITGISLNGTLLAGSPSASINSWVGFNITSGFVTGTNTLQFLVHNNPYNNPAGGQNNPSGFRCELGGFPVASGGSSPAAPTNLTALPGNTLVTLNWAASTGATSYNIKRSLAMGGGHTPP